MQTGVQWIIFTVGVTHSGKTRFGHALREVLGQQTELLDADAFDIFVEKTYPNLSAVDLTQKDFENRKLLKYEFFKTLFAHTLWSGFSPIVTHCHMTRSVRDALLCIPDHIEKAQIRRVAVWFAYGEEVIMKRIQESRDGYQVLIDAKDYVDLYHKQKDRFESIVKDEYEYLFVVDQTHTPEDVIKEIKQLVC